MTLNYFVERYGWNALNSISKYPSILTYHALAGKGALAEQLSEGLRFEQPVVVTEKIDGTNSRIVFFNNDYLIGSREELLYAKGDRIGNLAMNIAETLKPLAEKVAPLLPKDEFYVLYGETYGGVVTAASKQYTSDKTYAFRFFDLIKMPLSAVEDVLGQGASQISSWRDQGGQEFVDNEALNAFAKLHAIPTVPYLLQMDGSELPTTLKETFEWLGQFKNTQAGINHTGTAEGVIVRDNARKLIRKIRFEDYERTKKRGGF